MSVASTIGNLVFTTAHQLVTRDEGNGNGQDGKRKCKHVEPDENGSTPDYACNRDYYEFTPNFAASIFFAIAFALLFAVHIGLAVKWKKIYTWTLIMGLAWESGSFVVRYIGGHDQQNMGLYQIWMILFLCAPIWTNAFVFMTSSRLVYKYIPDHKIWGIRASLLGKLFIIVDIICFFVQIIGVGMLTDKDSLDKGINIFTLGLVVQEIGILVFIAMLITFQIRTSRLQAAGAIGRDARIKRVLGGMYGALVCISIRVIFHILEFQEAKNGNLKYFHKEIWQLILDAAVMLVANIILAVLHPGLTLGAGRDIPKRRVRKQEREAIKQAKANGTWNDGLLAHNDLESGNAAYKDIPMHSQSSSPTPSYRPGLAPQAYQGYQPGQQTGVYVPHQG